MTPFSLLGGGCGTFSASATRVDIAVKSSAFLLFELWLSDASSTVGSRYCMVCGVLLVCWAAIGPITCWQWCELCARERCKELLLRVRVSRFGVVCVAGMKRKGWLGVFGMIVS